VENGKHRGNTTREIQDGRIRFCPIYDGFEAADRRIGVYGSSDVAAKKALFLRTYSRDVTLFEMGDKPITAQASELLQAGIRRRGRPVGLTAAEVPQGYHAMTVRPKCPPTWHTAGWES
jgi:thioredoxin reductase